jgi:hypothetical protein
MAAEDHHIHAFDNELRTDCLDQVPLVQNWVSEVEEEKMFAGPLINDEELDTIIAQIEGDS